MQPMFIILMFICKYVVATIAHFSCIHCSVCTVCGQKDCYIMLVTLTE